MAQSLGDPGRPWIPLNTSTPYPSGIGERPLAFHHSWNWVSSRRYRGASVKAFKVSVPTTMLPRSTDLDQNILEAVWSRLASHVLPSVTVPYICGESLHGARAFLVPSSFKTYVHRNGRQLALCGMGTGLENIPCSLYWSSFLCPAPFHRFQSCCTLSSRRVSLAFFFVNFIVVTCDVIYRRSRRIFLCCLRIRC